MTASRGAGLYDFISWARPLDIRRGKADGSGHSLGAGLLGRSVISVSYGIPRNGQGPGRPQVTYSLSIES